MQISGDHEFFDIGQIQGQISIYIYKIDSKTHKHHQLVLSDW